MLLPKPRPRWRRIVSAPAFFGAVKTVLTSAATGTASIGLELAGLRGWAIVAAVATALAIVAGIADAVIRVHRESQRDSVHELEGCLETLVAIINPPDAADYDPGLRATLHLPTKQGRSFVQVVDYVGDRRGGRTARREFRADAGLVARVLQSRAALAASRTVANHEAYVRELITDWGYTEAEARDRDMSAMSWMAVPIEHDRAVQGLLYLDSTRPKFFDESVRERACVAASVGIAKFTIRRYTR